MSIIFHEVIRRFFLIFFVSFRLFKHIHAYEIRLGGQLFVIKMCFLLSRCDFSPHPWYVVTKWRDIFIFICFNISRVLFNFNLILITFPHTNHMLFIAFFILFLKIVLKIMSLLSSN